MSKYFLVIVDTTQIQPYVFGSNKLRENIGASYLVSEATSTYAIDVLRNIPKPFTIGGQFFDENKIIEDATVNAELMYAGGGNFSVLFKNNEPAQYFIRELSKKILCTAPGLQIEAICEEVDWVKDLANQYKDIIDQLAIQKRARTLSTPLAGLAVTRACQSTGQVAVGKTSPIAGDQESILYASAEVLAKRMVINNSNERLQTLIPEKYQGEYTFPYDFDQLGRTSGEFSYIAVVHIDGNGMGDRISKITGKDNRDYIIQLRKFSEALNKAGEDSLKEVISDALIPSINKDHRINEVELKAKDSKSWYLPIRPIVYGGDDLTFVCDARLGISLVINYIKAFEKNTADLPDGLGKATACGGICMIKTHYPFSDAYKLAENLCHSAKIYRKDLKVHKSFIDWHFTAGGLYGDIKEIRSREYMGSALTLKPISVDNNDNDPLRSWNVIENGCRVFQGDAWKNRRSKVKALRDTLRGGPDEFAAFKLKYLSGKKLEQVTTQPDDVIEGTGWKNGQCCYYDAIELSDWYISLPLLQEEKDEVNS
jgi:hypothetical protein